MVQWACADPTRPLLSQIVLALQWHENLFPPRRVSTLHRLQLEPGLDNGHNLITLLCLIRRFSFCKPPIPGTSVSSSEDKTMTSDLMAVNLLGVTVLGRLVRGIDAFELFGLDSFN